MKLQIAVAAVAASLLATEASSETLLLNCRTIDTLNTDPTLWFAKPPTDRNAMISTLYDAGVVGFAVAPSETWEIVLPSGEIRDPDAIKPRWRNAEVKPASIQGVMVSQSGSTFLFSLNRINNRVTLDSMLDAKSSAEWEAAHGKPFPALVRVVQQCSVNSVGG